MDPPNITWRELTKPYGHTHSNGRKHGPFDTESLIKAVVEGVDPDGNKMHPSMPRYLLSEKDAHALIAYLRVIDKDLDPGLTGSSIKLGVLLPGQDNDQNPLYALVRGFFTELNAKGGIYGRKVEPVFGKLRPVRRVHGGCRSGSLSLIQAEQYTSDRSSVMD
jgi:hypothetical protein